MDRVSKVELHRAVTDIMKTGDLDKLTTKKIRLLCEKKFSTDLTSRKDEIDRAVMSFINKHFKDGKRGSSANEDSDSYESDDSCTGSNSACSDSECSSYSESSGEETKAKVLSKKVAVPAKKTKTDVTATAAASVNDKYGNLDALPGAAQILQQDFETIPDLINNSDLPPATYQYNLEHDNNKVLISLPNISFIFDLDVFKGIDSDNNLSDFIIQTTDEEIASGESEEEKEPELSEISNRVTEIESGEIEEEKKSEMGVVKKELEPTIDPGLSQVNVLTVETEQENDVM